MNTPAKVLMFCLVLFLFVLFSFAFTARAQDGVSISACADPGLNDDIHVTISVAGSGTVDAWYALNVSPLADGFALPATWESNLAPGESAYLGVVISETVTDAWFTNDGSLPACHSEGQYGPDGGLQHAIAPAPGSNCAWYIHNPDGGSSHVGTYPAIEKDGQIVCDLTLGFGQTPENYFLGQ